MLFRSAVDEDETEFAEPDGPDAKRPKTATPKTTAAPKTLTKSATSAEGTTSKGAKAAPGPKVEARPAKGRVVMPGVSLVRSHLDAALTERSRAKMSTADDRTRAIIARQNLREVRNPVAGLIPSERSTEETKKAGREHVLTQQLTTSITNQIGRAHV